VINCIIARNPHKGVQQPRYGRFAMTSRVVDYKVLTGLSLLQVSHFRAMRGASLKDLNQLFPCQPMKYEETCQCWYTTQATRSKSNLPSRTDNPQSSNNKQEGPSDSNYACIKAQYKTRTKHIRTRNQSL
jgi:hypothetical protein